MLQYIEHRCIKELSVRTDAEELPDYRHELYGKQEGNCIGCLIH